MYKFEFTEKELNLILSGLGKLPADQSFHMINKIHRLVEKTAQSKQEAKSPSYVATKEPDNEPEVKKADKQKG